MGKQQMIEVVITVSLSSDGSRVAIGAPLIMMEMELDSGHVRIFRLEWNYMDCN